MTYVQYQEPYSASTRGDRYGTLSAYRKAHGMAPHRGMDWAPGQVNALAVADGVVVLKKWSDILGNVLVLKHADGMYSGCCHLSSMPKLAIGAKIGRHKSLGVKLGMTGSAATGVHLHLTISEDVNGVFWAPEDEMRDPLAYIISHSKAPVIASAATVIKNAVTGQKTYTVISGDTLSKIGKKVGVDWEKIYAANKKAIGSNPNALKIGLKLTIPKS